MVLVGVWIVYKHRGLARNIGGGMVIAALLATYSRASYVVGAVVGLSLFVLTESRYKWMVLSGVMGMMVMWWIVAPRVGGEGVNLLRVYSVESRIRSWEEAGRVWQESPVVGIGYNRYQVYMEARQVNESIPYHPSAPDNAWLYILATTGIVGMVSWLWLLIAWWQSVNVGGRLSLVAILAHSVFNNSFFLPFVLLWWWLLLAHQEQERKKQFILSS
jgi:O-antigen ligase